MKSANGNETMRFATKLALMLNIVTEAGCGINALLRDPTLFCSFVGTDPVIVPLFGVTLTSLSAITLLAFIQNDKSAIVNVLVGLTLYHFGVAWLFGVAETNTINARFPATDLQKEMMGNNGSIYGATFHLIEGAITIWGLLAAMKSNDRTHNLPRAKTKD